MRFLSLTRSLLALASIVFVAGCFARPAEAGLIVQRPLYVGLERGLVGFWSFDGKTVVGTRAYDMSGQGNYGTLTGSNGLPVRTAYYNGLPIAANQSRSNSPNCGDIDGAFDKYLGNTDDASSGFDGRIDDFRVYDRLLSADEIKRLYNAGR